ncbi:hypothetical protein DPMN_001144 [Dreissena polymorpha]|uniref:Uncharacterized protein n=1 Tax=Dreissena polymorpha TaxID=45954 RepID=A0A9D4MJD0_DREPO|nr:hypothetical protein DPMN_001144 [Dreissena polymorpha]
MFWTTLFLIGLISNGNGKTCQLENYFPMTFSEVMSSADILVYGETMQHKATKIDGTYVIEADYKVRCVFKRVMDPIEERITITRISPRDQCMGTPISEMLRIGDHSIVSIKKNDIMDANVVRYDLNEVMAGTSAGFIALRPYFLTVSKLCGLQSWESPSGAVNNTCPVCGTANVSPEVSILSDPTVVCNFAGNATISDNTGCDLYMDFQLADANTRTCVQADYSNTCVNLTPRPNTAVCNCGVAKDITKIDVDMATTNVPRMWLIAMIAVLSMIQLFSPWL